MPNRDTIDNEDMDNGFGACKGCDQMCGIATYNAILNNNGYGCPCAICLVKMMCTELCYERLMFGKGVFL